MTALLLIALLGATHEPAPRPDSPEEAARLRNLFSEGQRLFSERRFADAAASFEQLYALRPHPSVLFNLARCYEKLQETARALRFYRDYLHQSPDAKDRGLVLDSIAALEARLRKRGVSQLIVYTEPPGARVQVNGKDIGESPASVELVPGVHPLVVSAEGYVTETQYVTVRFDKLPEAVISLVRSPEAEPPRERAPVNPRPAAPRPPAPAEALPQAAVAIEAGEQAEETHVQVAPWIAAGGAVAGVAVGAGFGWKASDTANTYRTTTQFDRRPALKAEIESQALVANGAFIVAGAAAVTAVVLLLVSR